MLHIHQILHPVAKLVHHVAILHQIGLVAHPPASRNHVRATFLQILRHRDVHHPVERIEHPLRGAAHLPVDQRQIRRRENVT
jgi:hypothetical protein